MNALLTAVHLSRAGIVQGLCEGVAKYCPIAWVGIISNPVNSTVPIAAEVFKRAGAVRCAPVIAAHSQQAQMSCLYSRRAHEYALQ